MTTFMITSYFSTTITSTYLYIPYNPFLPSNNALWQFLFAGDFVGLVVAVYTTKMGEYFFAALMLLLGVPLYIRTQSLTFVVLLWVLCSGLLLAFVPLMVSKIVGLFIILAVGGILFMLFSRLRR
jgi:hypothetical protein